MAVMKELILDLKGDFALSLDNNYNVCIFIFAKGFFVNDNNIWV